MVLPATPGGSPAAREWQVNVPLTRNNDLPYGFFWRAPIPSRTPSRVPDRAESFTMAMAELRERGIAALS